MAFFLALDYVAKFATVVALGSLAGAIAEGAFCLAATVVALAAQAVSLGVILASRTSRTLGRA